MAVLMVAGKARQAVVAMVTDVRGQGAETQAVGAAAAQAGVGLEEAAGMGRQDLDMRGVGVERDVMEAGDSEGTAEGGVQADRREVRKAAATEAALRATAVTPAPDLEVMLGVGMVVPLEDELEGIQAQAVVASMVGKMDVASMAEDVAEVVEGVDGVREAATMEVEAVG